MANRPRHSVLSLFDPLNSPARGLPSTPERKENFYSSPKTVTKNGGQRDLASETMFFKRTYSRNRSKSVDIDADDGCLVDLELDNDVDDEEEYGDGDEQAFSLQRQPLLELTPRQPRVYNSALQTDHTDLASGYISPETIASGMDNPPPTPLVVIESAPDSLSPQTPSKSQYSPPSSCESSPCDSMSGSPTIRLPILQPSTDHLPSSSNSSSSTSTLSAEQPQVSDLIPPAMSLRTTTAYLTPSPAVMLTTEDNSVSLSDSSQESRETVIKGSPERSENSQLGKNPPPEAQSHVLPSEDAPTAFHAVFTAPAKPKPKPQPVPYSPPMLTDRPIPILAHRSRPPLAQPKPRRRDRSVDLHTSILLNTSDVEASVDLLNDDMSFLANLSDRSVDAAGVGNISVMAGFGRKGCRNVFKIEKNAADLIVREEDEDAFASAPDVENRSAATEKVDSADIRTNHVQAVEGLAPCHVRRPTSQLIAPVAQPSRPSQPHPHHIQLPPSPPPHEIALPPSPPPIRVSLSARREDDTIHPNAALQANMRPHDVYFPPSPPPMHLQQPSRRRQESQVQTGSKSSSVQSSMFQPHPQPHQIHLPPSPPPAGREMPKPETKPVGGGARRISRVFTAPPPAHAMSTASNAGTVKETTSAFGLRGSRRSSIAIPPKVVPTLAPIRPLAVTKKAGKLQPASAANAKSVDVKANEVSGVTAAAAPLARSRSRASLLVSNSGSAQALSVPATRGASQPSKIGGTRVLAANPSESSTGAPAPAATADQPSKPIRPSIRERLRNGAGSYSKQAPFVPQVVNPGLASSTSSTESSGSASGKGTLVNANTLLKSGVQRPPRGTFMPTSMAPPSTSGVGLSGIATSTTRTTSRIPSNATAIANGTSTRLPKPASRIAAGTGPSATRLPAPTAGVARKFGKY